MSELMYRVIQLRAALASQNPPITGTQALRRDVQEYLTMRDFLRAFQS